MTCWSRALPALSMFFIAVLPGCSGEASESSQEEEPVAETSQPWSVATPKRLRANGCVMITDAGDLCTSFEGSYDFLGGGPAVPHEGRLNATIRTKRLMVEEGTRLHWMQAGYRIRRVETRFRVEVSPAIGVSFGGVNISSGSGTAEVGPYESGGPFEWQISGLKINAYSPLRITGTLTTTWTVQKDGEPDTIHTKILTIPLW